MFNLRNLRKSQKGFTLIELLIVIAIIGIIAALLIPNFLDSLQKAKQKRTMADMRNTGTAMMSWLTDQSAAAAAAGQTTYTAPPAATFADVEALLEPRYIKEAPENDAWGNTYSYCLDEANVLNAENVLAILSGGRDGTLDNDCGADLTVGNFDPTDYDQDIAWGDGYFILWPGKDPAAAP